MKGSGFSPAKRLTQNHCISRTRHVLQGGDWAAGSLARRARPSESLQMCADRAGSDCDPEHHKNTGRRGSQVTQEA